MASLVTGCGREPSSDNRVTVLELAEELPHAEVLTEPVRIDIGNAEDRQRLGGGWSRDEVDARDGSAFAWATGSVSELRWPLLELRPRTLRLRCRPLRRSTGGSATSELPPQTLRVEAPGLGTLAELELGPGLATYEIPWPIELQSLGESRLSLHWGWHRSPAKLGRGGDRRQLAAAVYELALGQVAAAATSDGSTPPGVTYDRPVAIDEQRWWLPWGSQVELFVELPGDSSLVADGWSWRGAGRLWVEAAAEGEQWRSLGVFTEAPSGPLAIGSEAGLYGLRLRMLGESPGALGGIAVSAARIVVPSDARVVEIETRKGEALAALDRALHGAGAEPGSDISPAATGSPLILYVIDTLRADRLAGWNRDGGIEDWGRERPATPHLDAFARQARIFEHARAQSSWTKASMATVMTGLDPLRHGAFGRQHVLAAEHGRLAEMLADAGYRTAAFVTNPNLTATFGFDRGFEHFEYLGEEARADEVHERLAAWLRQTADDPRPPFVWLHVLDPHSPYSPPESVRRRLAPEVPEAIAADSLGVVNDLRAGRLPMEPQVLDQLRALYDAEIAHTDAAFGELRTLLEESGLYERSWIALLSDHGEEFMEHGNLEHGRALFAESIRVPFWVKAPADEDFDHRQPWPEPVQHLDILPSLARVLGLAVGAGGTALLPGRDDLLEPRPSSPRDGRAERLLFAHLHLDGAERVSVFDGRFELLAELQGGRLAVRQLFDLEVDPAQSKNLVGERPVRAGYLASALKGYLAEGRAEALEVELDDELRRSLEALGYL